MGWSFRRRIKVIPGVYLNVSKRGISTTVGVRGASLTFRGDGTYANAGIPGTGISSRQKIPGRGSSAFISEDFGSYRELDEHFRPQSVEHSADYHFVSADPLDIVSPDLEGLQTAVIESNRQRDRLKSDIYSIYKSIARTKRLIATSKIFLLYFILPPLRNYLLMLLADKEQAAEEVKTSIQESSVILGIDMDSDLEKSYKTLLLTFKRLSSSEFIWDITSASDLDRIKSRSVASSTISRQRTHFSLAHVPGIDSVSSPLHFANANGADIFVYPGFFVMYKNPESLGILELSRLSITFERTGFLETEVLPSDSKKLSEVWERSNKDGSRDKRYAGNKLLPVMEYGEITFKSKSGIFEKYMTSNCQLAYDFVEAIDDFISRLHE